MIYRVSALAVAFAGLASAQSMTTMASSMASMMSSMASSMASSVDLGSTTISLASSTGGSVTVSIPAATATSYPINVGAVPLATRQDWCQAQRNVCTNLCSQMFSTGGNVCDPNTLDYTCQCSQITTPDLARYNNTIPYQECITYRNNCVAGSTMDLATQQACLAIQCGGMIAEANSASTSSSASMTATGTGSTAAATAATTTAAGSGNAAPAQMAQNLGLSIVVAGAALIGLAL